MATRTPSKWRGPTPAEAGGPVPLNCVGFPSRRTWHLTDHGNRLPVETVCAAPTCWRWDAWRGKWWQAPPSWPTPPAWSWQPIRPSRGSGGDPPPRALWIQPAGRAGWVRLRGCAPWSPGSTAAFEDLQAVALPCLRHRLIRSSKVNRGVEPENSSKRCSDRLPSAPPDEDSTLVTLVTLVLAGWPPGSSRRGYRDTTRPALGRNACLEPTPSPSFALQPGAGRTSGFRQPAPPLSQDPRPYTEATVDRLGARKRILLVPPLRGGEIESWPGKGAGRSPATPLDITST